VERISESKYRGTYGIHNVQDGVKMDFVTQHAHGTNVGSRLYVLDPSGENYQLFQLKNREFSFEVDVSKLMCGMNGAMYFSEMAANGEKGVGNNNAGAKYGTGYCDAQCPHDMKFIAGEANTIDWKPNPHDLSNNMGSGKYGACCAEMDIWEANSMANAYTPHTCATEGPYRCEGIECGDNDKDERYEGVCDKDGCDINPYRMGNTDFYGRGPDYVVDTLKPMTVVTEFLTTDGTDDGDMSEIRRYYVQDGNIIHSPSSTILGPGKDTDSITDQFCDDKKDLFGDVKDFQELGGMAGMGDSLERGQVMIFSLWDDVHVNMLWLDSAFPLDKPVTDPGIKRGDCPGGEESTPTYVRDKYPDSYVIFKNAAVGEIGSTVGPVTPTAPSPTPPSPTPPSPTPPTSGSGYCNYGGTNDPSREECDGIVEGGPWCNENEAQCTGACNGNWCSSSPTPNPPTPNPPTTPAPTKSPTGSPPTPPSSQTATTTRYWDCSGGSCGCGYGPGDNPVHCESGSLFAAPSSNAYDADFYGTAAVSAALGGDYWQGDSCGKCFKLSGPNSKTLVLKATNFCPPGNPKCENGNAHFDISAPGFDYPGASLSNTCSSAYPDDTAMHPPQVCAFWSGPGDTCNCDAIEHPTLRQGCKNFLSLGWNNPTVNYEAVTCPDELDESPPCRSDGTWPEEPPEFCDASGSGDDDDDNTAVDDDDDDTVDDDDDTTPEGCFSNNYKTCLPDTFTSDDTCNVIWLPTGAQKNCLALWKECTGESDDSCCGPAKCYGDSSYAACVPEEDSDDTESPSASPSSEPCIECNDTPTGSMVSNGVSCADVSNLNKRCAKDSWINKQFCQLSCYNSGNGYEGDVCCNGTM